MDTAIAKAQEKIMRVSSSKEALRAYQMREMALSDYTSGINYAREEGKQEGKREGRQEGRLEILNLLKAGKSVEEISRLFHVD